jgi:hypothetical protein
LGIGTEGNCADGWDSDGSPTEGGEAVGIGGVGNDGPRTVAEGSEIGGRESEGNPRLGTGGLLSEAAGPVADGSETDGNPKVGAGRLPMVPPDNGTDALMEGLGRPAERSGRESDGSPAVGRATGIDSDNPVEEDVAPVKSPARLDDDPAAGPIGFADDCWPGRLLMRGGSLAPKDAGPEGKPDS